jgi:hypothetical protein
MATEERANERAPTVYDVMCATAERFVKEAVEAADLKRSPAGCCASTADCT